MNKPETSSSFIADHPLPATPDGATAAALCALSGKGESPVLAIVEHEGRAAELVRLAKAMAPDLAVMLFPPWDSLPHDRLPPSAGVLGRRAAVLAAIDTPAPGRMLIVGTPEALVQRVAAKPDPALRALVVSVGEPFEAEAFAEALQGRGYWSDERVDEPGEFSAAGATFDVYPADAEFPLRIEQEDGRIVSLRRYDPLDQRSVRETDRCSVFPAREGAVAPGGRALLLELLPEATLVLTASTQQRAHDFVELVEQETSEMTPLRTGNLYASREVVDASLERHVLVLADDTEAGVPRFGQERDPDRAFARFHAAEQRAGRRVLLAAPDERLLKRVARRASRAAKAEFAAAPGWAEALAVGTDASLVLPVAQGFRDAAAGVSVVTAADLLGSRAAATRRSSLPREVDPDAEWRIGDAVVHREHGVCILTGLETVASPEADAELIRLAFADDEKLLLPVQEADFLWRYGSQEADIKPDVLHGTGWTKRRDKVAGEIADAMRGIAELAAQRAGRRVPPIEPPAALFERFAARFPFEETPDQSAAIAEVLQDLRSGRPMDRLVCGDVGFGKTEVALRAAAAVALAGRQVAIAAPTTVLVRQHLHTFRRRFASLGIEVAELSRFVSPAEAKAARAGLADGRVRIVIGTHALVGKGVAFQDLALVVIDEEQRFGERHKEALRALAGGGHVLAMTATPIPRTLQMALAGLRDVSVIATPPVSRRPIRTSLASFTPEVLRESLKREKARGGQSFVVCPHIDDLAPVGAEIASACPDLNVVTLHAKLAPAEIDAAMIRFAEGEGDCLLATNIVESGLDLPGANTMVIWRPDRFGLAQLHQLRGRVGRGRARGVCLLLTPDEAGLTPAAKRRLATLSALDRPGAGFAISARDLDLRGSGDLFGPEQSGHITTIGTGLARHIAEQEIRRARGEAVEEPWRPEIAIADPGGVPVSFVPDEEARLNVYLRLAGLRSVADVEDFTDELHDRFGHLPDAMERLLAVVRLAVEARSLDVGRLAIGPEGVSASPRAVGGSMPEWAEGTDRELDGARLTFKEGRVVWSRPGSPTSDIERATALLAAFEQPAGLESATGR